MSRSAYYRWLSGKVGRRVQENERIADLMEKIHTESPDKGYRRIRDDLEKYHSTKINDSKGTNTDSTVKAVAAMTRPTVLILGGSDKHVPFDAMAEYIRSSGMITHCVLMGQTGPQIRVALLKAGFTALTDASDMRDAVVKSRALSVNGGNVLLSPACASRE